MSPIIASETNILGAGPTGIPLEIFEFNADKNSSKTLGDSTPASCNIFVILCKYIWL